MMHGGELGGSIQILYDYIKASMDPDIWGGVYTNTVWLYKSIHGSRYMDWGLYKYCTIIYKHPWILRGAGTTPPQ